MAADLLSGHDTPAGFSLAKRRLPSRRIGGIPGGILTPALTTGAGISQHICGLGEGVDQRVLVLVSRPAAFLAAATLSAVDGQRGGHGNDRQSADAVLVAGGGLCWPLACRASSYNRSTIGGRAFPVGKP